MTIPAERLAVIAVATLPITALSAIYGMNIIVNDHPYLPRLLMVPTVMAIMSALLPLPHREVARIGPSALGALRAAHVPACWYRFDLPLLPRQRLIACSGRAFPSQPAG